MARFSAIKFKLIFIVAIVAVFVFWFSGSAYADYVPRIYVTDLTANAEKGQINGQFSVWNSENYYFTDLNYSITLFKGIDFNTLELIDRQVPQEILSVAPKETIIKPFSYQYPKNIVSGDYTLRIQIIAAKGTQLGWNDQVISLEGQNNFLDIISDSDSPRMRFGGETELPLNGINVPPNQDVIAFLKLKNLGDAITVTPQIKIFKRQYNMDLLKEYKDSPITVAAGQTKEVSLTMPKFDAPESYLAQVKFYADNEQVSRIQYFRWVVIGSSGKIMYIKSDKDSYLAGEEMQITVDSIGPADLTTIEGAKLEVVVYDQNKNVVGNALKDISLNFGLLSSVVSIPVAKDLFNPSIDAKITKSGQVLDDYKIALPVSSEKAKQLEKNQSLGEKIKKYFIYLILALLIIVILIIIFVIARRRTRLRGQGF